MDASGLATVFPPVALRRTSGWLMKTWPFFIHQLQKSRGVVLTWCLLELLTACVEE